ncbi:glycosyltransferase family 2 protein [Arcanobacterium canis]|uniref:Glycosyltransferase family 2 protein n=2 Tax=Arcanobacterium canis TaxID=999183 RepID=A0ABY8G0G0_9ACTO|nr:glycosyltransferase family 2 protein [Arcanobacterium canis]WFM84057.1 glycosyltransferase family 2 protein [Arcanobacterium canis]
MSSQRPLLWMVIPCYNEEQVLPITAPLFDQQLTQLIDKGLIDPRSQVCFVNDGSSDTTWSIIKNLAEENRHFAGITLSRNRGHQHALLAGLMYARSHCDITVSLDADGQDDIGAVEQMVREYLNGHDVVYGVRSSRETDTFFKRFTAQSFYKLLESMGADVIYNHADYRLMSARALNGLAEFKEVNLFLRGLVPLVGYSSTTVEYERAERIAGESHYPLGKMLALAFNGITSLSIKPIRIVTALGLLFSLFGFLSIIWVLVATFTGATVVGWASLMCIVLILGGIQLLSLGVIGEYIGKIYLETKHRPRFLIEESVGIEN